MLSLPSHFQKQYARFLLPMPDAEVYLIPDFIPKADQQNLYEKLEQEAAWKQEQIKLFGKAVAQPRLTAWYADAGKSYTYSGLRWEPLPWLPELLSLRQQLKQVTEIDFNSVLLNLYRDGQDSMGWHADNEPELGTNPIIASITLGAERTFAFKHRHPPDQRYRFPLPSGSLLLMAGSTQHHWLHQLPKTAKPITSRLNLTFRYFH